MSRILKPLDTGKRKITPPEEAIRELEGMMKDNPDNKKDQASKESSNEADSASINEYNGLEFDGGYMIIPDRSSSLTYAKGLVLIDYHQFRRQKPFL